MSLKQILANVEHYYTEKITIHGATPRGVDWNSLESQTLRFKNLLQICDTSARFSLTDYGCGYGGLLDYLVEQGVACEYRGFDLSPVMLAHARDRHAGTEQHAFFGDESCLSTADYTVASGIFNVRLETSDEEWQAYMLHILNRMYELSSKGFAFNALTLYSDPERRRPDLYYADPLFFFDYCKQNFARFVTLLHDYPLYEWTLLVRKEV